VRIGVFPAAGGSQRLPALVGPGVAKDLIFSGRHVEAAEAHGLGLVNRVVPADGLLEEAGALTRRLAEGPTLAYALTKRAMRRAATSTFPEALEYEGLLQEIAGRSADYDEGVNAFVEKRPARFQGR
jgi:2-(1,2-epoxy-1,2-dihydrophenyl)acetyl-CoA isomerase